MILWTVTEVLLVKVYGVKSKPDLGGQSKTGSKSIIDIDSQEAQIIADLVKLVSVMELG